MTALVDTSGSTSTISIWWMNRRYQELNRTGHWTGILHSSVVLDTLPPLAQLHLLTAHHPQALRAHRHCGYVGDEAQPTIFGYYLVSQLSLAGINNHSSQYLLSISC